MQDFFFTFIGRWSYLGLFLILIAAGLGIPLPEDIPLVAAGWLVHDEPTHRPLYLMMLTGLAGVLVGDSLLFNMGRRYGDHVLEHKWLRRIAKPWLLEKARLLYLNHGAKILFAARFMPGLRSVLFLTAGAFRIPFWKFFCIDGLAALISVPTWVWAGWYFSGSVEQFLKDAKIATWVISGGLVIMILLWVLYEYRRHLSKKAAERIAHETAVIAERLSSSGLLGIGDKPVVAKSAPLDRPREPAPLNRAPAPDNPI